MFAVLILQLFSIFIHHIEQLRFFRSNVESWDSISREKKSSYSCGLRALHLTYHSAFLDLIDDGKQLTLLDPSAFLGGCRLDVAVSVEVAHA